MKRVVPALAFVLCGTVFTASPAGAVSGPTGVRVAAAACPTPPAAYLKGAKGSMWFAACVTCKQAGPRELARRINLSNNSASFVARTYATRAVASAQFRRFLPLVGGTAAAKAIIYSGCMAGFRVRGRP